MAANVFKTGLGGAEHSKALLGLGALGLLWGSPGGTVLGGRSSPGTCLRGDAETWYLPGLVGGARGWLWLRRLAGPGFLGARKTRAPLFASTSSTPSTAVKPPQRRESFVCVLNKYKHKHRDGEFYC